MTAEEKVKVQGRSKGIKRLMVAGFPFFLAGLLMASGLQWTRPSVAEEGAGTPTAAPTSTTTLPGSFAELADHLSPTVVNVRVTKIEKAVFHGPQMPDESFEDFFGPFFRGRPMPQMPEGRRNQGAGSGVIISEDGYILSNNHVVEGAESVTVTLADNEEYEAKVIGRDPKTDLAVLKIDAKEPLPSASMGDSERLKVGEWVVAIGNPFGLNHTVTSGIVSAKGRVIGAGPYDDFIQTDASINPGNSGGPLFNMKGELVGINTAIIPQGQGIGFAIPINTAKPLIPQMVSDGKVTRGYLGISFQEITPELAKALNVEAREGLLVSDVVPGSPAEQGGIERGDIITAYDGKTLEGSHELPMMVAETPVGKTVPVTVNRNGETHRLKVKVGKQVEDTADLEETAQPTKGKWGLQLHDLDEEIVRQFRLEADQGVVVVGVQPDSPAQEAGIRKGDIIVEVNRQKVDSVDEVKKRIDTAEDKDHLLLLVQREQGKLYVPLVQQG